MIFMSILYVLPFQSINRYYARRQHMQKQTIKKKHKLQTKLTAMK